MTSSSEPGSATLAAKTGSANAAPRAATIVFSNMRPPTRASEAKISYTGVTSEANDEKSVGGVLADFRGFFGVSRGPVRLHAAHPIGHRTDPPLQPQRTRDHRRRPFARRFPHRRSLPSRQLLHLHERLAHAHLRRSRHDKLTGGECRPRSRPRW